MSPRQDNEDRAGLVLIASNTELGGRQQARRHDSDSSSSLLGSRTATRSTNWDSDLPALLQTPNPSVFLSTDDPAETSPPTTRLSTSHPTSSAAVPRTLLSGGSTAPPSKPYKTTPQHRQASITAKKRSLDKVLEGARILHDLVPTEFQSTEEIRIGGSMENTRAISEVIEYIPYLQRLVVGQGEMIKRDQVTIREQGAEVAGLMAENAELRAYIASLEARNEKHETANNIIAPSGDTEMME